MPKTLQNSLLTLLLCAISVIFCYYWVDKPVVYWASEHHLRDYKLLVWFTHVPEFFTALTCLIFPILALRFSYKKWMIKDTVILTVVSSIVIADFIHTPLKIFFGRYWPATWINNNPSLLRDHVYGFNLLHYGSAYMSFPSGHTCVTTAAMTMLWFLFPKFRWLAVTITLLVCSGLIGLYYHFVSDVVAGGFLGWVVAYHVFKFSKLSARVSQTQETTFKEALL